MGEEEYSPFFIDAHYNQYSSSFLIIVGCGIVGGNDKEDVFLPGRKTHDISERPDTQTFFLE
jgi:hypothetical protein